MRTHSATELLRCLDMQRRSLLTGPRAGLVCAAIVALLGGCEAGESPSRAAPSASAPPAKPPEPPPPPPTQNKPVTFTSSDGATLAGELWMPSDTSAPAVVLVHRLNGDRAELRPLAERLAKSKL